MTLCLIQSLEHAQCTLDVLPKTATPFGMRFASSECKELLQDWMIVVANLMLDREELIIVDRSTYVGSFLIRNGSIITEVSTSASKARVAEAFVTMT